MSHTQKPQCHSEAIQTKSLHGKTNYQGGEKLTLDGKLEVAVIPLEQSILYRCVRLLISPSQGITLTSSDICVGPFWSFHPKRITLPPTAARAKP